MLFKCTLERRPKVYKHNTTCAQIISYAVETTALKRNCLSTFTLLLLLWFNNSVRSVRMNTGVFTLAYTLSKYVHNHRMALRQARWQEVHPGDSCAPQHLHWLTVLGATGQNVLPWNTISWICFQPQKVVNVLFLRVKIKNSWAACSCVT